MQSNTRRWQRPAPEYRPLFDQKAGGNEKQTADGLPVSPKAGAVASAGSGGALVTRRPFSNTSRSASKSVAHALAYVEQRILDYLVECGTAGATADEVTVALHLAPSSATGRLSELTAAGRIIRTQSTRPTRRGRAAHVHLHLKHAQGDA